MAEELPSWAKKLLVGFGLLVVIPGVIYGLYQQWDANRNLGPRIERELLEHYAKALMAQDDKTAYALTSTDFQSHRSFEIYGKAQEKNREEYGLLQSLQNPSGIFTKMKESGRKGFYRGTFQYRGKKGLETIQVDIVEENGKLRIDRTFQYQVGRKSILERIF